MIISKNQPVQNFLYQQIAEKFADENYVENTRKEMGQPDCLQKPMYVVGKNSQLPSQIKKIFSIVQTILGTVTILPAIYWSMKALGEFVCLPVSSRILRNVMKSARKAAICPSVNILGDSTETIKILAKTIFLSTAFVILGNFCRFRALALAGIGITTFVGAGIYYSIKDALVKKTTTAIKKEYAQHINTGRKHLRMSVMVDGERIDTYIIMNRNKIDKRQRWILATNGNGVPAETVVSELMKKSTPDEIYGISKSSMLNKLATDLNANVVTYNYGGCLSSEGVVSAKKAAKIYQAMKKMLEDPQGLAAKEIIFYGHSIGGAIQAQGLKGLKASDFKKDIKYVCVKDRTFADANDQLNLMFPNRFGKVLRSFIQHLGWGLNVEDQCRELYDNRIPQVNINNAYDNVIKDPLITKFDSVGKDKKLVFTKLTDSYGFNIHMTAPDDEECDLIVDQIKTMLK